MIYVDAVFKRAGDIVERTYILIISLTSVTYDANGTTKTKLVLKKVKLFKYSSGRINIIISMSAQNTRKTGT